jgi:asparagine synthase (glutamine-hydrolysing)
VPSLTGSVDEVEQLMLADTAAVLPDQMLVKVDRASMAASLEVRAPFLDHRLLEWSWRQPTEIKTTGGVGKVVLRRVAERVLPAEIVRRPKMGFDPPLGAWLRDELRSWASDRLAVPRSVRGLDRRCRGSSGVGGTPQLGLPALGCPHARSLAGGTPSEPAVNGR